MFRHFQANDPERREWQNPEDILQQIGMKQGITFIDLGCGGGFFTLPAARIAGQNGKIYGVDINGQSIQELQDQAKAENLENIILITGKAEETVLCQSCADIVFLGTVLHDFDNPLKVLKNAHQMLKANGRLVNLDWKKVPMSLGPPLPKRFSITKAEDLIRTAGFMIDSNQDSGPYHYLITARIQ